MILVTGGAGFIGSNIVAALAPERRISVSDYFGTDDKWRNVARHALGDIVAPAHMLDWLEVHEDRVDAVIHMGAISATTERDADLILERNFRLSCALWRWTAKAQKPFIYASSAATYGDGTHGFDDDPRPDALAKLKPLNPYGWSKHLFDRWVMSELAEGGPRPPQWAGLKFFNVYGPNEYHKGSMKSVVAHVYPHAAKGGPVSLFRSHNARYPDGGQMRDFVYVGDCVRVVRWLLDNPSVSGLFNLGTGEARTFLDLTKAVFAALNRAPAIEYVDTPADIRDRYQYFTQARMERLRAAGYTAPFTCLEDGVGHYVRDYLSKDDPYF